MSNFKCYIVTLFIIAFTSGISYSISANGISIDFFQFDTPLIFLCMCASFLVHWIALIPSFIFRTERFFDLMGSVANVSVITIAIYYKFITSNMILDIRTVLLYLLVCIWAIRLGLFLFKRVMRDGKDRRFDEIKLSFSKSLFTWSLSSAWVFITTSSALASITSLEEKEPDIFLFSGLLIWVIGFSIEIISDRQKTAFRSINSNSNKFISSGLWSISRHPNYLGEILLWVGILIIALPTLVGSQLIVIISPIFVYFLLTRVSGINLLEDIADKRWGKLNEYRQYKKDVPALFPFTHWF